MSTLRGFELRSKLGASKLQSGWRIERPEEVALTDLDSGQNRWSGFMQSGFWSEFKRLEGYEVTRLIYETNGIKAGSATLLRFPHLGDSSFVLCPEGPALDWDDYTTSRIALRELIDIAKLMPNTLGLRIEPHLPTPLPRLLRNWANAPTDLTPADTLKLDDKLVRIAEEHAVIPCRVYDRLGK